MKTNTLALMLSTISLLSGCSALSELGVPKPAMALKDVQFGDIDLQTATLLFDVEVENPYAVALPLLNMGYSLKTRQNPLFDGQADIQTTIPAKEKKTVSLPVTLSYTDVLNAFKDLKDVRPGSTIPYDAALSIGVNTPVLGKLNIPLQKTGDLKIPALQDAASWKNIFNALDKLRTPQ
jgi:LEA14-like dessication related protein